MSSSGKFASFPFLDVVLAAASDIWTLFRLVVFPEVARQKGPARNRVEVP